MRLKGTEGSHYYSYYWVVQSSCLAFTLHYVIYGSDQYLTCLDFTVQYVTFFLLVLLINFMLEIPYSYRTLKYGYSIRVVYGIG